MEELLPALIENKIKRKSFKDLTNIKEKVENIYDSIKNDYPSGEVKEFNVSSSNFHKFKQWFSFHTSTFSEE
jgi:ACT domain-containing protein